MRLPADFTPLATFLRPPREAPTEPQPEPCAPAASLPFEYAEALGAARRFRAALCDALDLAVGRCLQTIARDVLGRELELRQSDVAAIVANALESRAAEDVLSIRANANDLQALRHLGFALVADERLRAGDIEIVLRSGTIDAKLCARLDAALALWNA